MFTKVIKKQAENNFLHLETHLNQYAGPEVKVLFKLNYFKN